MSPRVASKAALFAVLTGTASAFFPSSHLPNVQLQAPINSRSSTSSNVKLNSSFSGECLLTPEGYGFSSTVERIIEKAQRGNGFYVANANDSVIDVMGGITEGEKDVALVYDGSDLLGIFTETDYINVSRLT